MIKKGRGMLSDSELQLVINGNLMITKKLK